MKTICYQAVTDGGQTGWRRTVVPPCLTNYGGTLLVTPPRRSRAFVNGLEVAGGLQVVEHGDLVRIARRGRPEISYVVGQVSATQEPGNGRTCQLTGRPINGQAVRCSCGSLFASEVSEQLGTCPGCQHPLDERDEPPPEELL